MRKTAIIGYLVSAHGFTPEQAKQAYAAYYPRLTIPGTEDLLEDADLIAEDIASWYGDPASGRRAQMSPITDAEAKRRGL